MARITIDGEYVGVTQRSRQPNLLRHAHQTPTVPEEARVLVQILAEHFNIPAPAVRFRVRSYGRARRTQYDILLPRERMRPGNSPTIGHLRVGIVLHEFAHLLHHKRCPDIRCLDHGLEFCRILDEVLTVSEPLWGRRT